MDRIQALFEIFEVYLKIDKDEDWLDYIAVVDPSTISKYRNSMRPLTKKRIEEICTAVGITRADFDKPLVQLAAQLQVSDKLPAAVLTAESNSLPEDDKIIHELYNQALVIFQGLDPDDRDKVKIWVDQFSILDLISGNLRKLKQSKNKVLKTDFFDKIRCDRGIISMEIECPGLHYPNSHYLFEPIFKNSKITIFSGIYFDITGGMKDRIFATQCCMICGAFEGIALRDTIESDELSAKWLQALDNKIERRGKLLAKVDPRDAEHLRDLVFETLEILRAPDDT